MSQSITLLGTLTMGPQGSCEGGFPGGLLQMQFGLGGSCPGAGSKPINARFYSVAQVNSPTPAFQMIDGVGTGEAVTQGTVLYLRTTVPLVLRLTQADPVGGPDLVSVVPVHGLLIMELPSNGYLKLIEAQGLGQIEYVVAGNQ